jgi:hypothetical protein
VARSLPELARHLERIDAGISPPSCFVADAVNQSVVDPAERHRKFVARLAPERSRLDKAQVMWVRRLAATDDAGLAGHEPQVLFIAIAPRLGPRQDALVDALRPTTPGRGADGTHCLCRGRLAGIGSSGRGPIGLDSRGLDLDGVGVGRLVSGGATSKLCDALFERSLDKLEFIDRNGGGPGVRVKFE